MIRRAGYPSATLYASSSGPEAVGQLLWGEYVSLTGAQENGRRRLTGSRARWIDADALQEDRVLEIVFVDIGQGDGALIVTPEDRKMIVDAGEGDNMVRFLRWRFGRFARPMRFDDVIISHGDKDHWGGFRRLFDERRLTFGTVYHNGLVERTGPASGSLGKRVSVGRKQFITELVASDEDMRLLLKDADAIGKKAYAGLLKKVVDAGRVESFEALGRAGDSRRYLPGFGPQKRLSVEVLGPVLETVRDSPALRWLGSVAKTKNGQSVLLKVRYGSVSILLGGDLNTPSQDLLLTTHTGMPLPVAGADDAFVAKARDVFESDFAKACHHGSADFSSTYLRAVNPLATIVSSGDEEAYAHPRPDALGAYGLYARAPRPLIFSTELFRSSAERIKHPNKFRKATLAIVDEMVEAKGAGDDAALEAATKRLQDQLGDIDRSVAVYGAINLRTDGERAIVAYKIEKPRSADKKWDLYRFEPGEDGRLRAVE